jgi:hypothetical protein
VGGEAAGVFGGLRRWRDVPPDLAREVGGPVPDVQLAGRPGGGEEEGAASKTAKTEQIITGPPLFFLNMDNFHVVNLEEPEDESPA